MTRRKRSVFAALGALLVGAWAEAALAQSLEGPGDHAKTETRRVLNELIERAQASLRALDAPADVPATGGLRNPGPDGDFRIVNGIGTFRYPASGALLKGTDPRSAIVKCSGTLIAADRFLTAAHCVARDPRAAQYKIYLHSAGFFDVKDIAWPKAEYRENNPKADVAILTLSTPVERIVPVAINRAATPLAGSPGTIVGFGRTGGSNLDYGIKREGYIRTSRCGSYLAGIPLVCWDFDAEVDKGARRSNTCNVDSGGPLFMIDTVQGQTMTVVAGVTSGGDADAECLVGDRSYDVDVFHYRRWIEATAALPREPRAAGPAPVIDVERDVEGVVTPLGEHKPQAAFSFEVRPETAVLMVAMNGDDDGERRNDFDLYVIRGGTNLARAERLARAECKEDGPGQFGFCRLSDPVPGTWTAVVRRKQGEGLVQVVVTQVPKATK